MKFYVKPAPIACKACGVLFTMESVAHVDERVADLCPHHREKERARLALRDEMIRYMDADIPAAYEIFKPHIEAKKNVQMDLAAYARAAAPAQAHQFSGLGNIFQRGGI